MRIGRTYACPNCTKEYVATGTCLKCCTPECQIEWNKSNIPKYQACRKCTITFPVRYFSYRKATGKYMRVCQACLYKQRKVNHPYVPKIRTKMPSNKYEKLLAWELKSRYGITLDEYKDLFVKQKGVCAICKRPSSEASKRCMRLFVDHCHSTKEVRGLLCHACNAGIGLFKDSPKLLIEAMRYIGEELLDKLIEDNLIQWGEDIMNNL